MGFLSLPIVLLHFPVLYLQINILDFSHESKTFIVALRSHKSNMSVHVFFSSSEHLMGNKLPGCRLFISSTDVGYMKKKLEI